MFARRKGQDGEGACRDVGGFRCCGPVFECCYESEECGRWNGGGVFVSDGDGDINGEEK